MSRYVIMYLPYLLPGGRWEATVNGVVLGRALRANDAKKLLVKEMMRRGPEQRIELLLGDFEP